MKHILLRRISQIAGTLLANSYFRAWTGNPQIYQGKLKGIVPPILNCYACPSATVACPAGSAQHFAALRMIPYYVIGSIAMFGVLIGRAACGWVCPFGLLQDLEYKLGRLIKLPKIRIPKWTSWGRYLFLIGMVILAPILTGTAEEGFVMPGKTTFCKFCPAGALEGGIPQVLLHANLRPLLGSLFTRKMIILGIFLIAFLLIKRPFCRVVCPVGAFLGLFNKISLLEFRVDCETCTSCGYCRKVCPVDIAIHESPNSHDCIRCGDCIKACPLGAVKVGSIFGKGGLKESPSSCPAK